MAARKLAAVPNETGGHWEIQTAWTVTGATIKTSKGIINARQDVNDRVVITATDTVVAYEVDDDRGRRRIEVPRAAITLEYRWVDG